MNKIEKAALKMASLSVYKGILNRTVPAALQRLIWAADNSPREFLEAWGDLFSALCAHGASENFAGYLTELPFYEENAFSLAAAGGAEKFPPAVKAAAKRDLQIILELSSLTPDELIRCCSFPDEVSCADLPKWKNGLPVEILRGDPEDCFCRMRDYYRKNGCGMYARYRAFIWRGATIIPVEHPDQTTFADLKGYETQRNMAIENTQAFLSGLPANNCLLYGDRGTGKSSTVKALLNEFYGQGLRVIEMPKEHLMDFPALADRIAALPMKFIVFIDDISFSREDDTYASLKAVLEGGLAARPENTLIYATSNRRHLLRETFSDRAGDEIHLGDTIQESLSLADRFGLSINFMLPDKAQFLEIVRQLAVQRGLENDLGELEAGAERWATQRGGRSPRCARQYIRFAESRIRRGKSIL